MSVKKIWNKVLLNFFNGVVLLLPLALTTTLIGFLVRKVNDVILNPIMRSFEPIVGKGLNAYAAKGLIFIIVICAVAFIGWGAKILFINRVFSFGERILIKVPVMGRIYNASKQIFSSFMGQGKTVFKQVVLIEYPRKGLYSIGFTTGTTKGEIKEIMQNGSVNVFVPTTPNPTSGVFLVVPKENIQFLKMTVEEGMKLVMSGGSVTPEIRE
ncbi:MAG: DUF502 domain-containing protein [Candidatus Aadella gelida]|nr:DUF502 domain-containing protein [Candidatus Aadella gelida]